MSFSDLPVGTKYMYPKGPQYDKWGGIWMKIHPMSCFIDDEHYYFSSVCLSGPHVGVLLDHETDPDFNECEVYVVY